MAHKIVPVDSDNEQRLQGARALRDTVRADNQAERAASVYRAMLAASPPFTPSAAQREAVARAMCWHEGGHVVCRCDDAGDKCGGTMGALDDFGYLDLADAAWAAVIKCME